MADARTIARRVALQRAFSRVIGSFPLRPDEADAILRELDAAIVPALHAAHHIALDGPLETGEADALPLGEPWPRPSGALWLPIGDDMPEPHMHVHDVAHRLVERAEHDALPRATTAVGGVLRRAASAQVDDYHGAIGNEAASPLTFGRLP